MNIQLNDKWKIYKGETSFVLEETYQYEGIDKETRQKTGKIKTGTNKWYYPRLIQCLDKYLNECFTNDDTQTLLRLFKKLENIEKEVKKVNDIIFKTKTK